MGLRKLSLELVLKDITATNGQQCSILKDSDEAGDADNWDADKVDARLMGKWLLNFCRHWTHEDASPGTLWPSEFTHGDVITYEDSSSAGYLQASPDTAQEKIGLNGICMA